VKWQKLVGHARKLNGTRLHGYVHLQPCCCLSGRARIFVLFLILTMTKSLSNEFSKIGTNSKVKQPREVTNRFCEEDDDENDLDENKGTQYNGVLHHRTLTRL